MGARTFLLLLVILCEAVNAFGAEIVDNSTQRGEEKEKTNETNNFDQQNSTKSPRYHVASVDFGHVADPLIIALWVVFASLAKMGFHLYNKLSSIFPESCMLILLGVLVGIVLYFSNILPHDNYYLSSQTFFLFLLPPIVLEAGYFMPNRAFFDNIGTILLFAVIGTLFNTLMIGVSLWVVSDEVLGWTQMPLSLLTCLVFSSLISAVDPVAVLAVFEEIHVNEVLFIIVFGESLLNDAVTVVLYHMFESFTDIEQHGQLIAVDFVAGVASFVVVSGGGTLIGLLYGALTSFITKYTGHVRVIEPVFVFMMAYLAYLTAELFHLSGILSIVFCGVFMKRYVKANLSEKSVTTVTYFLKMLSSVSETVIFMFLGLSTVTEIHDFRFVFVMLTLIFCFIYRVIGVVIFSYVANYFRVLKLSGVDQFVMAYGGLRGAIAFSLVVSLPESIVPEKRMLVTTTIVVIYFTVFIQGITIKPLVNLLRVKKDDKHEMSMNERIHTRMTDHCSAGMEDIIGHFGHHRLRDSFQLVVTKYLEPLLLREKPKCPEMGIYRTFSKLNMKDAVDYISRHGSFLPQTMDPESLTQTLRRNYSRNDSFLAEINAVISLLLMNRYLTTGHELPPPHADTILDMQSLDVNYSRKMADAGKCHHIVEENMFRPRRTWTSHSRHQVDDVINHPPFHHNLRHHLRHMVSRRTTAAAAEASQRKEDKTTSGKPVRNVSFEVVDASPAPVSPSEMEAPPSSDSDSDPGITFTVEPKIEKPLASPVAPTAAESSLPWKRAYIQPALPSFTHTDQPVETTDCQLAECPSWAANLDYIPESPHVGNVDDEQEKTDDTGLFSIPPPWRTSPSSDENRTENDSALPKSHIDLTDSSPLTHITENGTHSDIEINQQTIDKPRTLHLHDKQKGEKTCCESALPWRSPSASNEVEPMISPSASQIWSHAPLGQIVENGQSHHSDPITGHHHVTAITIYDDLQDYHSLLPGNNNATFHTPVHLEPDIAEVDDDEAVIKLQMHRRHPSFVRPTKGHMLERRPSVSLPIELNREEDCRDRIHKWLQSSHPDSLACPPDYVLDGPHPTHQPVDETAI